MASVQRNESWRDHRPNEIVCIAARDVIDQRLRAGERGIGGGVAVAIRASLRVVHRDLADEGAQPRSTQMSTRSLLALSWMVPTSRQSWCRWRRDHQAAPRRRAGEAEIGVPGLERKGVTRQPIRERASSAFPSADIAGRGCEDRSIRGARRTRRGSTGARRRRRPWSAAANDRARRVASPSRWCRSHPWQAAHLRGCQGCRAWAHERRFPQARVRARHSSDIPGDLILSFFSPVARMSE